MAYGLLAPDKADWNLSRLFGKADEKEIWIAAERGHGSYSSVLDERWANSIFSYIEASIKLRENMSVEGSKSDKLDIVYEINAKLTKDCLYS